ncbi:FAD-binding oxidoreductase [Sphingobium sp. JS3065]|uniref:FAD-binding oxidoreductase n=1 Tax=Sphingobium sp. JS3065 TaxID=2970925 RepID=UPI002263B57F|nr:FAD-binding oxidoreductase [Sphingobium sp. JS3065]UZW57045.1 FAD-binding oxidoreductase [Sphingobium sp. JS3065]
MTQASLKPGEGLIEALRAIVGDRGLILGDEAQMRSCDPFRVVPMLGSAIVRPANTQEVSAVMACCHARGQRVVVHGGRTGVAGGAYVGEAEIALSLERMNAIEEIDPVGQIAVVQAGAVLETVHHATAEAGLFYPVDLGAKGTATIGGTIATNAGGNRVIRWGMTRQNVMGLEAVLPDGTIVSSMNRLLKNNSGYDLKHLFVGTEGTLGIVTRAVLRLAPLPSTSQLAFVSVPGYDEVLRLLERARKLMSLSAFEVMWQDYYSIVASVATGRLPVEPDQPFYVLIETMGYDEDVDRAQFDAFLEGSYEAGLLVGAVTASSDKQAADFWAIREPQGPVVRAISPFVTFDISLDIARANDFVIEARRLLDVAYSGVRTAVFGHLGDNNIHFSVNAGPDTLMHEMEIEHLVYDLVSRFDGAITAEHGIGQLKKAFLPEHRSAAEMETMRRIRDAIDPNRLLNHDVMF